MIIITIKRWSPIQKRKKDICSEQGHLYLPLDVPLHAHVQVNRWT